MRVTAYSGAAFSADLPSRERVYQTAKQAHDETRSLAVPLAVARSAPASTLTGRPLASFLAQLIAKAEDMPGTRLKRRIEAADGASLYRATMEGPPAKMRSLRVI